MGKSVKPDAVIVNTSRGEVIDENELARLIQSDAIAGAGLDVFDVEPLPADHPIRMLDNVVLTGHTGYVVDNLYPLVYGQAVENILAWQSGTPTRLLNAE